MNSLRAFLSLAVSVICAITLSAQKVTKVQSKPIQTEIEKQFWLVGSETRDHWKGLLPQVNAPSLRTRAFPGQRLTIAVLAQGESRDRLLRDAIYTFNVEFPGSSKEYKGLHPSDIRQIKASGSDFVLEAMKAASVESKEVEGLMSMVSLALFDLDWTVPADAKDGTAKITGTFQPRSGKPIPFVEGKLEIWSCDKAVREGEFKDLSAVEDWWMSYYLHPEPSRLLNAIRLSGDDSNAFKPNQLAFYVEVLKSSPEAAWDLMVRLRGEEKVTRMYGLHLLQEAKYDISMMLSTLPMEEQEVMKVLPTKVPALPDPYDFSINLDDPLQITTRMDMLWSTFVATGNPKPVRAIASILGWRADGKAFAEMMKSGKKIEKITPEIERALAYAAAGWSLGSFVRHHELVADYVACWKQDPATPATVREELNTLFTNPSFKRK